MPLAKIKKDKVISIKTLCLVGLAAYFKSIMLRLYL